MAIIDGKMEYCQICQWTGKWLDNNLMDMPSYFKFTQQPRDDIVFVMPPSNLDDLYWSNKLFGLIPWRYRWIGKKKKK